MNNSTEIITASAPLLLSIIGMITNWLKSSELSPALIRGIEICEGAILEEIKNQFNPIMTHIKSETNRILLYTSSKYKIKDIQSLEFRELGLNLKNNFLKYIQGANKDTKKLNSAISRIRVYRYIFFIIITLAIIEILFLIFWPILIPFFFFIIVLVISIFSFLIFLYDLIHIYNLKERVGRKYGI